MNVSIKPLILDREAAAAIVSLSVASMERLVREGTFPAPRTLSDRRVGWLVHELEEWAQARPVSNIAPPTNTGHENRPQQGDRASR